MSDKAWLGEAVAVNIPLQSPNEDETKIDENPPVYQHPRVDFNSGWRDRGFAIAFWIQAAIVIILAFVLGVPTLISHIKVISEASKKVIQDTNQTSFNIEMKPIVLALSSASGVAGLTSFGIFFLLQQCSSQFIKFSYMTIIMMNVIAGVGLFFVFWPLCFIPGLFVSIILLCLCCVRKRVAFAEAHLNAGCAALRSHPSLILIAIVMLIIEFLWFVFWFLMVLGIHRVAAGSTSSLQINTNETIGNTQPMWIMTTPSFNDEKIKTSNSTTYSMRGKQRRMNKTIYEIDEQTKNFSRKDNSSSHDNGSNNYGQTIVGFLLLLSWYWGAITFGNVAHFITACMVGQWWFGDENSQQYSMKNSIKRAFTTSFGTICFGSFFEALIKTIRRSVENKNRQNKNILSWIIGCIIGCILQLIEKVIGYLNEWAFIFAALNGQGFVEGSKSFIELFKNRGWTAIINDTVVGITLTFINLGIAILSAIAGGLTIYYLIDKPLEQLVFIIIIISIVSFIIGLLMSSVITTILTSCVRTVFVCFALNPAALGATHPDHLQRLTKVWHKFYPQEFAGSGYANQYKDTLD